MGRNVRSEQFLATIDLVANRKKPLHIGIELGGMPRSWVLKNHMILYGVSSYHLERKTAQKFINILIEIFD